jgi:hypothetical protein
MRTEANGAAVSTVVDEFVGFRLVGFELVERQCAATGNSAAASLVEWKNMLGFILQEHHCALRSPACVGKIVSYASHLGNGILDLSGDELTNGI